MFVAKKLELNLVSEHTTPKLPNIKKAYAMQEVTPRGAFYGCDNLAHYKRECLRADKTRPGPPRANGLHETRLRGTNTMS